MQDMKINKAASTTRYQTGNLLTKAEGLPSLISWWYHQMEKSSQEFPHGHDGWQKYEQPKGAIWSVIVDRDIADITVISQSN